MYTVVKTFNVGNQLIDNAKKLNDINGWVVGKPHKWSIMAAMITCKYTQTFVDETDYKNNEVAMQTKFENDLANVGFTKDQIAKYSKTILPTEVVENESHPMTWKEWHENRQKNN